jgi:hypothetical protein
MVGERCCALIPFDHVLVFYDHERLVGQWAQFATMRNSVIDAAP